ncbi:MAG: hypothetical protein ACK55Z_31810 [bacterium]
MCASRHANAPAPPPAPDASDRDCSRVTSAPPLSPSPLSHRPL